MQLTIAGDLEIITRTISAVNKCDARSEDALAEQLEGPGAPIEGEAGSPCGARGLPRSNTFTEAELSGKDVKIAYSACAGSLLR
jgi:hypothetical protein